MSKMKKKDWQDVAKSLKIKFQQNDTVAQLQTAIAFKLNLKAKKGQSLDKVILAKLDEMKNEKPKATPKPKTTAKKSDVKKDEKLVKFDEIFDEDGRDKVLITIGDKEAWLKRDLVKVDKSKKEIIMPKYLADVKGL